VLIAPGEEFSFVDRLGPVDGEHGYLPELVIKNNRTEPEFGGGICQVSSTFFRAAFNSGFKITERRNHAYPVQYYRPYGMDATIYIPKPDLKFRNNTSGYVLLQPKVEGFNLIVQAFGSNDGRSVTIDGPHILERRDDGGMRTLFTQTVKDASGETIIEDNFFSNYKSPSLFPHPGEEVLTVKPKDWSEREWKEYLRTRPAGR
jgi:vancomycin resistance protein YoaR